MTDQDKDISIDGHKLFSGTLYMLAGELIEKEDRTPEESDTMIQAAHASAYHWAQLKGHIDEERWIQSFAVGQSIINYAYLEIGDAGRALYHAKRCLEYFDKYGVQGFPDAYGYDGLAKAYDMAGDTKNRDDAIKKAIEAGNKIEEDNFRASFFEELAKVNGYDEIKGGM